MLHHFLPCEVQHQLQDAVLTTHWLMSERKVHHSAKKRKQAMLCLINGRSVARFQPINLIVSAPSSTSAVSAPSSTSAVSAPSSTSAVSVPSSTSAVSAPSSMPSALPLSLAMSADEGKRMAVSRVH